MNRPARRALERPDVKARWTWDNAGQHGPCLARGAKWSQDTHDASPWIRRESYSSQSPVDAVMGGDGTSMLFWVAPVSSPPLGPGSSAPSWKPRRATFTAGSITRTSFRAYVPSQTV